MIVVRRVATFIVLVLLVSSCGVRPKRAGKAVASVSDWAERLAALDPAFVGGAAVRSWIERASFWTWRGDPWVRELAIEDHFGDLDRLASDRCREYLNRGVAEVAIGFLRSDAGQAMVEAEIIAMATQGWHDDDLPRSLAVRLSDPDQVGQHAVTDFRQLVAGGGSVSPIQLSFNLACQVVTPREAESIQAFLASEAGMAWLAGRTAAWPEGRAVGRRAISDLVNAGYAIRLFMRADSADLILPRAEFSEDVSSGR